MRQKLSASWVAAAEIPAMAGIVTCLFVISMKQKDMSVCDFYEAKVES